MGSEGTEYVGVPSTRLIKNLAHVYREVIRLRRYGILWHMDDDPEDCFADEVFAIPILCDLQDKLIAVCDQEGVDIHGVCVDVLNSVDPYGNIKLWYLDAPSYLNPPVKYK